MCTLKSIFSISKIKSSIKCCNSFFFFFFLQAAQVLNFGRVMTASEALEWGFVSELFTHDTEKEVWDKINEIARLPLKVSFQLCCLVLSMFIRCAINVLKRNVMDSFFSLWYSVSASYGHKIVQHYTLPTRKNVSSLLSVGNQKIV